jgi:hypothetical protein
LVAIRSNLGRASALCGEIPRSATDEKHLRETARLIVGGSRPIPLISRSSRVTEREIHPCPERRFGRYLGRVVTSGIRFEALTVISSVSGARDVLPVAMTAPELRGTIMTGLMKALMS